MNESRFFGMLGFAMRAGKLSIGSEQVILAMQKKRSELKLILLCTEASEGTKKKIKSKSEFYGIECIETDVSMSTLGEQLGKLYAPSCIGVKDSGFAKEIKGSLQSIK